MVGKTSIGGKSGIQVIDRAVMILEAIAKSDGLPLTSIARQVGMATSTVYRILTALEINGLVRMDGETKHWFVGVRSFEIGNGFLRNRKPIDVGRRVMRDLMEEVGESVNMAVIDHGQIVYIAQYECHSAIRAFHRPGSRGPIHCSGLGKALLAWRTGPEVSAILHEHGLQPFTHRTITSDKSFILELAESRKRGWAVDVEERYEGMRCVAAAIFDESGRATTGISISGPSFRLTDERLGELGPAVKRAAMKITELIGGKQSPPMGMEQSGLTGY